MFTASCRGAAQRVLIVNDTVLSQTGVVKKRRNFQVESAMDSGPVDTFELPLMAATASRPLSALRQEIMTDLQQMTCEGREHKNRA